MHLIWRAFAVCCGKVQFSHHFFPLRSTGPCLFGKYQTWLTLVILITLFWLESIISFFTYLWSFLIILSYLKCGIPACAHAPKDTSNNRTRAPWNCSRSWGDAESLYCFRLSSKWKRNIRAFVKEAWEALNKGPCLGGYFLHRNCFKCGGTISPRNGELHAGKHHFFSCATRSTAFSPY